MTYNPNVPLANQRISDTQLPILTNFQQANLVYGDPVGPPVGDHYAFDDATANARKHRKVTLPDQTATIASVTTTLSNIAIIAISKPGGSGVGNVFTRPYFVRDDVSNAVQYPMFPIQAFGEFSVPGAVLTANSWGITSVTRLSAGRYRVALGDTMPDTAYAVLVTPVLTGNNNPLTFSYSLKTTINFEVQIVQSGSFSDATVQFMSVCVLRY